MHEPIVQFCPDPAVPRNRARVVGVDRADPPFRVKGVKKQRLRFVMIAVFLQTAENRDPHKPEQLFLHSLHSER
ncbi:UNVERIFIED_CONTAM: hypothetical protein FKN15_006144 [Acipenser sinensis]